MPNSTKFRTALILGLCAAVLSAPIPAPESISMFLPSAATERLEDDDRQPFRFISADGNVVFTLRIAEVFRSIFSTVR